MGNTWRCYNIDIPAKYSWKTFVLCIWWDRLGVFYYELLQRKESITLGVSIEQFLAEHSGKNGPITF